MVLPSLTCVLESSSRSPLKADNEPGNVSNQVLNNVIVKNNLLLADSSSTVFGQGTKIFFSRDTEFKSLTTGDIQASAVEGARMQVYASTAKAGLVQLASAGEVRGAKLLGSVGISSQVVVTAFDLASEFDIRLENNLAAGEGIVVSSQKVDPNAGTPDATVDTGDDITQFTVGVNPNYPGFTPIGGIIMWAGSDSDIPAGWAVCNQSTVINGVSVPDLSDRFIIAKSSSKATGTTGAPEIQGATDGHKLIKNEIPAHRHGILHSHFNADRYLSDEGGGDYDNVESSHQDGEWKYRDIPQSTMMNDDGSRGPNAFSGGGTSADVQGGTISDLSAGDSSPGAAHSHNLSSVTNVLPKWFALAFIIRTK